MLPKEKCQWSNNAKTRAYCVLSPQYKPNLKNIFWSQYWRQHQSRFVEAKVDQYLGLRINFYTEPNIYTKYISFIRCLTICISFFIIERSSFYRSSFVSNCDRQWIYYDNSKRKKSWIGPDQLLTSTPKLNIHGSKVLLCNFIGYERCVLWAAEIESNSCCWVIINNN